jgi:hypothetical protein
MPGPFPGMDPYLEDPDHWRGVHGRLIVGISDALNASLPEGFVADLDERVYVIPPDRSIYPDVAIVERPGPSDGGSSVAVLTPPAASDPPYVVSLRDEPVYESFVEIRTTGEAEELVAVIEVLSPSNKEPASEGRDQYLRKQREVLASAAHLLEIDLLRAGEHTVAARRDVVAAAVGRPWDYLVCLHRAGRRWEYEFWPFTVRDRLPTVHVPLAEGVPDCVLDLQSVFDRAYDSGPYRRRVNYQGEPRPALPSPEREWANALLIEKGIRP